MALITTPRSSGIATGTRGGISRGSRRVRSIREPTPSAPSKQFVVGGKTVSEEEFARETAGKEAISQPSVAREMPTAPTPTRQRQSISRPATISRDFSRASLLSPAQPLGFKERVKRAVGTGSRPSSIRILATVKTPGQQRQREKTAIEAVTFRGGFAAAKATEFAVGKKKIELQAKQESTGLKIGEKIKLKVLEFAPSAAGAASAIGLSVGRVKLGSATAKRTADVVSISKEQAQLSKGSAFGTDAVAVVKEKPFFGLGAAKETRVVVRGGSITKRVTEPVKATKVKSQFTAFVADKQVLKATAEEIIRKKGKDFVSIGKGDVTIPLGKPVTKPQARFGFLNVLKSKSKPTVVTTRTEKFRTTGKTKQIVKSDIESQPDSFATIGQAGKPKTSLLKTKVILPARKGVVLSKKTHFKRKQTKEVSPLVYAKYLQKEGKIKFEQLSAKQMYKKFGTGPELQGKFSEPYKKTPTLSIRKVGKIEMVTPKQFETTLKHELFHYKTPRKLNVLDTFFSYKYSPAEFLARRFAKSPRTFKIPTKETKDTSPTTVKPFRVKRDTVKSATTSKTVQKIYKLPKKETTGGFFDDVRATAKVKLKAKQTTAPPVTSSIGEIAIKAVKTRSPTTTRLISRSLPQARTRQLLGESTLLLKQKQLQKTSLGVTSKPLESLNIQSPKTKLIPKQTAATEQLFKTPTQTDLGIGLTATGIGIGIGTSFKTPPPPPPVTTFPPVGGGGLFLPGGGGGFGFGGLPKAARGLKFAPKYTPSVEAAAFNIKSIGKKSARTSGLTLRGL